MNNKAPQKKIGFLFRFHSIHSTLLFSFGAVVLSTLLIFMLVSVNHVKSTVLDNSKEYTMKMMKQVNEDINSYITYMENISEIVVKSPDVKEFLFAESEDELRRYTVKQRILNQFAIMKETRSDIYNIGIIGAGETYLLNETQDVMNPYANKEQFVWYQDIMQGKKSMVLTASHIQNIVKDEYKWVITLSRGIINPQTKKVEGVFFVDLNYSSISDLCDRNSFGSKGYTFIVDKDGLIIYHPMQQLLYSGMKEELIPEVLEKGNGSFLNKDKSMLYTVSYSDKTEWAVTGVSNYEEMLGQMHVTRLIYSVWTAILLAGAIIISIFLANRITRPIKLLGNSMKRVQTGDFAAAKLDLEYENEIGELAKSFDIMTDEIHKLMDQNVEEQRQKRKSELRALQAQINPHFLYNTLDSIIWMAEDGGNKEVVLMTSALSKLLRKTIHNEHELVKVKDELEYVKEYLTIQKMRYKDKLEYEIEVEAAVMQEEVVKLVLQPLVENAIYHGIKYEDGKGMIRIVGTMHEDTYCLQVVDNGRGMSQETLQHILEPKEDDRKGHVGVNNVHNRIQLYYGKEYGLHLESGLGEGTIVSVKIPRRTVREEQHAREI